MRKNVNAVTITGRIYKNDLNVNTVQNQSSQNFGKEYIGGSLDIAVDDDGLNVIPVYFTYVTETTSSGNKNLTYAVLKKLIEGKETNNWSKAGKESATIVEIRTSLAINDFYGRDGNLVSAKRAEGGFVKIIDEMPEETSGKLHDFIMDMLITKITRIEANTEKNIENDYAIVKGAVFNFRNDLLPIELTLRDPAGIDYLEGREISSQNPFYTKVWGKVNCTTVKIKKVEESAWGAPKVTYTETTAKEWLLTGLKGEGYEFGEEGILTVEELTKAMQNREVHLADVKKKAEEYATKKASGNTSTNNGGFNNTIPAGKFNF